MDKFASISTEISMLFLFGTLLPLLVLAHACSWMFVSSFFLAHEGMILPLEVAHHQLFDKIVL